MNCVGDLDRVFIGRSQNVDHDGRLSVETGHHLGVLKTILDVGKIAHPDLGTILGRDHDVGEVFLGVGLTICADHDGTHRSPERAGGEGQGGPADGVDEILKGEAVVAQFLIVGLDTDFERLGAAHVGPGNFGQIKKLVFDPSGCFVEIVFAEFPSDRNGENLPVIRHVGNMNFRSLGLSGKCVDRADAGFDFVAQLPKVRSILRLHIDICRPAPCFGIDQFDPGKVSKSPLNRLDDMFLNVLRARAPEAHVDFNFPDVITGLNFERDFIEGGV